MELTNLETAVAYMFSVFMSKQGDNGKMDKWDFIEVLNKELPSFTKGKCEDDVFHSVDLDEDGHVDFKEFALLVASYASEHADILQAIVAVYKSH
ncbi:protein S100-A11-like [Amphiprion ocellaris]|uniref:protein S100-A11-like n=1 Tax=Amphiprion ocellaris TaxID=80972 RepID=UPI002411581D|nr:protein S100-A11-like [Amphiprion ocellaris]XP_054873784.1 protein S100-A11-like [Amphiprion ocellaris]